MSGNFIVRDRAALINVNSATRGELTTLKGIGPELASRIIKSRPFDSVDNLTHVSGIGDKLMRSIRHQVVAKKPPNRSSR